MSEPVIVRPNVADWSTLTPDEKDERARAIWSRMIAAAERNKRPAEGPQSPESDRPQSHIAKRPEQRLHGRESHPRRPQRVDRRGARFGQ